MTPELEKKLIEKYPGFFRDITKSPQETCMCWGIETGDGWYNIIDNLCGFLKDLRDNRHFYLKIKDEFRDEDNYGSIDFCCPEVVFDQVKSKYATLRVYWHFAEIENYNEIVSKLEDPEELNKMIDKCYNIVDAAIDFSEYLSASSCEVCGKPGKIEGNYWVETLCPEHSKENKNEEIAKL
jgi:hypothetical protein